MLRLSTSAGRSVVSVRSSSMARSTVSEVIPWPVRRMVDQLLEEPLGQRDLGGLAVEGDLVAAHVDVGVEGALDQAEVLVAGTEQGDHVDAVGHHHLVRVTVWTFCGVPAGVGDSVMDARCWALSVRRT